MKKETLDPREMLAHFYHTARRYTGALNTANSSNLIETFVLQNATENVTPLMPLFTAVLQQTFRSQFQTVQLNSQPFIRLT
jgi:hypothetical protein